MGFGIALALAFALTNGLHDASNAIATLVATRAARPLQAVLLAGTFNMLGPLLVGAAVADVIAGIVTVAPAAATAVIGAGLFSATAWNVLTWRLGLPSSSGHALAGGLVGAALVEGGADAVRWGGLEGAHPIGVVGVLVALALSPLLGALAAAVLIRAMRGAGRRLTARWQGPVRGGQWAMSAALAFSHGANDAQKSVGVVVALLLAGGAIDEASAPVWAVLACAFALTLGTTLGGWSIVRTVGRRIYRLHPADGLVSEAGSSGIIFGASLLGAPTSTTQVVASSVVGIGGGRGRWRHVRWAIVRHMALAWLITIPATSVLAAVALKCWKGLA
jgi:PiT family inorganic phosphate transporter